MTIEPGDGTAMPSPQPPADPPASSASGEATPVQSTPSRAVEGQAGEQRELTSAVTDMRNQLMRLSQELAELRVRPTADEGSDAQNNTVTVEMREAVRFLSERLDGVTRMVAQRGEELADIRTALTAIDAHVRSQAETIGVLSNGLQALPSYGERVSILQDNLQVLHRQLVAIEESIGKSTNDEKLGERLAAIESAIAPLGHRMDEIGDLGTAQSSLLSRLESSSSQLQQSVLGVHESVSGIHESIAEPIGDLGARIDASVGAAVRETEQRLMAHVDEAVMALAQALLRRRPAAAASEITGTPIADLPGAEPAAPVTVPEEIAPSAPVATPSLVAAAAAAAADPQVTDDFDFNTALDDDAAVVVDADEREPHDDHEVVAAPADGVLPPVEEWGARTQLNQELTTDGPQVGVLADATEDDGPEPGAPIDQFFADDAPSTPYSQLPPPVPGTAVGTPAWTPQTPPERNPADPTVTLEAGKKKRRWGRNK